MIAIATLALILAAPDLCVPTDDPALRARIEPLLGSIDRPVRPEDWLRLPPEARAVLEAIASSPDEFPTRRAAALDGVAAMGGDGTLHRRLAADGAAPFLVRYAAVRGMGPLLPPAARSGALLPLLRGDADVRIRAAAAETITRGSPAEGCAAVQAQALREGADGRVRLERALAACVRK